MAIYSAASHFTDWPIYILDIARAMHYNCLLKGKNTGGPPYSRVIHSKT